jgi:hypothetical protein
MDSLIVLIATLTTTKNFERNSVIKPPVVAELVLKSPEETNPQGLSTCFENRYGSCWTEE